MLRTRTIFVNSGRQMKAVVLLLPALYVPDFVVGVGAAAAAARPVCCMGVLVR